MNDKAQGAANFKFVLKLTRTGKSGIEMSGYIGESARDKILEVIASDCQGKNTRSEEIRFLSEEREKAFVKHSEATAVYWAACQAFDNATAGVERNE